MMAADLEGGFLGNGIDFSVEICYNSGVKASGQLA
jgi:hypothetical protein